MEIIDLSNSCDLKKINSEFLEVKKKKKKEKTRKEVTNENEKKLKKLYYEMSWLENRKKSKIK